MALHSAVGLAWKEAGLHEANYPDLALLPGVFPPLAGNDVGAPRAAAVPPQRTLGLALGGGFARGMAHIGVLKVLEEAQIPIAALAGTSSGSVIAAGYCSGVSLAELAKMARRLRFRDFARWTLERGGLCTNDPLGAFITRTCPRKDFSELQIPLAVVATELLSGKPAIFRKGPISSAVRASCAYPGMFTPVEIDGVLHVDGMLSYEVPTTPLKADGHRLRHGSSPASRTGRSPAMPHHFLRSSASALLSPRRA